jgi:pimeloyl-ACP methyl ester carboxylesterase
VREIIRLETLQANPCNIEIIYHKGTSTLNTPETERPSVILLPYWGGTARTYSTLQTHLAEHHANLTTIAVSYPGTGRSSQNILSFFAEGSAQTVPVNNLASMATSLLLELATSDSLIKCKTGIVLVAHSMGGKIASAILASGINLSIKALILLAPAPPGPIGLESDE